MDISSTNPPSPPVSSLSTAYVFPVVKLTAPTPLVVWVRIIAPDVDSPPASPLLDSDDFSKCIELSLEAAATAHAAYHAWNPDTALHRRWSNAFPTPTRPTSAPEENIPTPPRATRPTSDTLPLQRAHDSVRSTRQQRAGNGRIDERRGEDSDSRREKNT